MTLLRFKVRHSFLARLAPHASQRAALFKFTFVILFVAAHTGCSSQGPSTAALSPESVTATQALHSELASQAAQLNQDDAYALTQDDLEALASEQVSDSADQAKLKIFVKN